MMGFESGWGGFVRGEVDGGGSRRGVAGREALLSLSGRDSMDVAL